MASGQGAVQHRWVDPYIAGIGIDIRDRPSALPLAALNSSTPVMTRCAVRC